MIDRDEAAFPTDEEVNLAGVKDGEDVTVRTAVHIDGEDERNFHHWFSLAGEDNVPRLEGVKAIILLDEYLDRPVKVPPVVFGEHVFLEEPFENPSLFVLDFLAWRFVETAAIPPVPYAVTGGAEEEGWPNGGQLTAIEVIVETRAGARGEYLEE
jgi:hypothetical protein